MLVMCTEEVLENHCWLICSSCEFGALGWPCTLHTEGDATWVQLHRVTSAESLFVTEVDEYMVLDYMPTTGHEASVGIGYRRAVELNIAGFAAVFRSDAAPMPLLRFLAHRGFQGLT